MTELILHVEETPDGRLTARAVGESISIEAESIDELPEKIRQAVVRRFPVAADRPAVVHLYFLHDGGLASTCTLPLSWS
ncbi:MAG TPA: hypothetical protein VMY42_07540 [Thermoguttaceae bacterium]|nr:hypothetical protein [Thermoguttaceae bacterium]